MTRSNERRHGEDAAGVSPTESCIGILIGILIRGICQGIGLVKL